MNHIACEEGALQSRRTVLEAVRRAKPPLTPLPSMESLPVPDGDLVTRFRASVEAAGGHMLDAEPGEIGTVVQAVVRETGPAVFTVFRGVGEILPGIGNPASNPPPGKKGSGLDALPDRIDVLVCRGTLGVAENGAVWLPESGMGTRAAPFLAEHVVLVLDRAAIVADMHEAYRRLDIASEGFGVFMAGPSKTADIEQTLVIGAHGPCRSTVLLVGSG